MNLTISKIQVSKIQVYPFRSIRVAFPKRRPLDFASVIGNRGNRQILLLRGERKHHPTWSLIGTLSKRISVANEYWSLYMKFRSILAGIPPIPKCGHACSRVDWHGHVFLVLFVPDGRGTCFSITNRENIELRKSMRIQKGAGPIVSTVMALTLTRNSSAAF